MRASILNESLAPKIKLTAHFSKLRQSTKRETSSNKKFTEQNIEI